MPSHNAGSGSEVSLLAGLDTLKRRRWYILVPAIVLALGAAAVAYYLPNLYRARVLIAAEPAVAQSHVRDSQRGIPHVQEQLRAVRESLLSRPVLEEVVQEFDLDPTGAAETPDRVIENVKSRVHVQVEGEYHFHIGFEDVDRRRATDVANRLGDLFIERASAVRARRTREESLFLEEEIEGVKGELAELGEQIREYKNEHSTELPERAAASLKQVEMLQERLGVVGASVGEEQAKRAALLAEAGSMEDQGVLELREPPALRERRRLLQELRSRYTNDHPEVLRLEKEIAAVAARGDQENGAALLDRSPLYERYAQVKAELQGSELRLSSYEQERRNIAAQLGRYQQRLDAAPEHDRVLSKLAHDYELLQTHYRTLLAREQEAKLANRLEELYKGLVFTVVEPARLPSSPHTPRRARLVLMGIAAGLGLGLLLAFGKEHVDTSFHEQEEVQSVTGLPVLAAVPSFDGGAEAAEDSEEGPGRRHSLATEQYRFLGVRLRESLGPGPWVLGITSAVGGEGKSTTALNLATDLARVVEGKVLLVDGDLRKPRLAESLDLEARAGIGELLTRPNDDIDRYITKVDLGKTAPNGRGNRTERSSRLQTIRETKSVYVLPGSSPRTDSVRLLGSGRAHAIFAQLRKQYEFIVVDLPPLIPIADSRVAVGLTDGLLLVVRARRTRRELLPRALDGVETGKILGVVLNDVDFRISRCAYAYRYYEKHYLAAS